jgi:hypothetical protein
MMIPRCWDTGGEKESVWIPGVFLAVERDMMWHCTDFWTLGVGSSSSMYLSSLQARSEKIGGGLVLVACQYVSSVLDVLDVDIDV